MVALQSTTEVVPGRRNQCIFSPQILDDLIRGSLDNVISLAKEKNPLREQHYVLAVPYRGTVEKRLKKE